MGVPKSTERLFGGRRLIILAGRDPFSFIGAKGPRLTPPPLFKGAPTIGNGRANAITCGKARDKTEHQKSKKKLRQVWIKIIHPHMTIQCRVGFMATRLPAHLFQSSFVEKSYALGQCRSHSNVRPTKNPDAFPRRGKMTSGLRSPQALVTLGDRSGQAALFRFLAPAYAIFPIAVTM